MKVEILEDEQIDDLQYKGLKIIQKKNGFRFGLDAVLLADFTDVRKNGKAIDLGAGTGIVSILLAGKTHARCVKGLEIQSHLAAMAQRSVRLNSLEDRVEILQGDIKNAVEYFGPSGFDAVATNPPYMNKGGGLLNPSDTKAVSRHELLCTLEDVIRVSSKLLCPGGVFSMVHRPERLADIVFSMRTYGIEPKFMRFVHPAAAKKPNLLLVKGTRGGRPLLKVLEPLYVYNSNGLFSDEINKIYQREVKAIE